MNLLFLLFIKFTIEEVFVLQLLAESECPKDFEYYYSKPSNTIKTMVDFKPKVVQDFTVIRDKFPCNRYVIDFLRQFVSEFGFLAFYPWLRYSVKNLEFFLLLIRRSWLGDIMVMKRKLMHVR